MQQYYYDLHIHTALSPCADNDMVPCDIAGMAYLNGLDIIAITDHNSIANAKAVIDASVSFRVSQNLEKQLIVLPGIEVTTEEEVHVICLFDSIDTAQSFDSELCSYYSSVKNRPEIFGEQLIVGSNDVITGTLDRMLIAPSTISFDNLFMLAREYGSAFVPAHIDRDSFSVISNLGFLPPNLDISTVEYSPQGTADDKNGSRYAQYPGKKIITSSDAHQLHQIGQNTYSIPLPEFSAKSVIDYLRFPLK